MPTKELIVSMLARLAPPVVVFCAVVASSASLLGCERAGESKEVGDAVSGAPQREVVVYVSADESIARPILDAFTKETGIAVRARFDGENAKTTALAAMITTEHDAPRADVFWSSECFAAAQLGRAGMIAPWRSYRTDHIADSMRGESGWWHGFAPRMRVLVYDPRRISQEQLPKSMLDLATPALGRRIAMADPRFGTTRGHVGAFASMMEWRDPGSFKKWVDGFVANAPRIQVGGNAAVVDAVLRNEADFGLTDSDDFYAAIADGATLAMIPLRQFPQGEVGGGPVMIPNSVAQIANCPHPVEANELMLFLMEPKVTEWLAASKSGNFIVESGKESATAKADHTHSPPPDGLPLMPAVVQGVRIVQVDDPFQYDEPTVLDSIDQSVALLREAWMKQGSP